MEWSCIITLGIIWKYSGLIAGTCALHNKNLQQGVTWEFFSGFSTVLNYSFPVDWNSLLFIIELLNILIILRHDLTKHPFILIMNPANPRLNKPFIRLCNTLWWLHQALHHGVRLQEIRSAQRQNSTPAWTHCFLFYTCIYCWWKLVCLFSELSLFGEVTNNLGYWDLLQKSNTES